MKLTLDIPDELVEAAVQAYVVTRLKLEVRAVSQTTLKKPQEPISAPVEASTSIATSEAVLKPQDGQKRCSSCQEVKTLDAFGNRARSNDGLDYNCRSCKADQERARRASKKNTVGTTDTKMDDPQPISANPELAARIEKIKAQEIERLRRVNGLSPT